jgi:hypothetical protein
MPVQHDATGAMQTEASKTRSLDIAFLVDADNMRQLQDVLRKVGDSFEYQVRFSDGHALQYHDIEEVLKQPNSRARSIVSIIAGATGRSKQSAYVVLKDQPSQSGSNFGANTSSSPSVEYTLTGTQKDVIYIGDKLDEWTEGIRQGYSIFYSGVFQLLFTAAVIAFPIALWVYASPHLFLPAFLKAHDWVGLAFMASLWTGEYWLFKLFPRATFAIGQGARRHQFFTYLRTGVLGAFVLSLVASLLANWLTRPR